MNGLSTKLQECLALNTGRTFLVFVSNAIRAHKESKKRKVEAAPSSSAPTKYHVVYPPRPTYQPHQYKHQHQQQQWASHPHPCPHQHAVPKALPPPPPMSHLPVPPTAGVTSSNTYFNYDRTGHFARECTALKKSITHGHVNHPPHGQ
jgi:hypothetical protein